MRLKKLIKDLKYQRLDNFKDCQILGISSNSQSIKPGYLFVAVPGAHLDGHQFIQQAIAQGAQAVILQKDLTPDKKVSSILVQDSRAALASVCAAFFNHPAKRLKLIGITGTNGKTSISYLLESILAAAGKKSGVIGTVNYRLGKKRYQSLNTTPGPEIVQSFLQEIVLAKSRYAIIEVSSHALAQQRLQGLDFSCAVFTNLTPEHLDYHGNLANYFKCKAELFKKLRRCSGAAINYDDPYGRKLMSQVKAKVLTYGLEPAAQVRAEKVKLGTSKTQFTAITPGGAVDIESPLIGRHNLYNILAACACAFVEGIALKRIAQGVKNLIFVPGRLERVDCGQQFLVFVDYAHTEDALENVLAALRQLAQGRIILVFGCGGDRDKAKRPQMGKVASRLCEQVILTSDNPRSEDPGQIIRDIQQGISKTRNNYQAVPDRFQAIQQALLSAQKNDLVVIAGKGHESTQIFADQTIHFNDREVIEQILQTSPCLPLKRS